MADQFQLETFLPYRMNRLAERASDSLARVYAERFRISVPQWRILVTVGELPGLSATAIAGRCALDKVQVSRAVSDLESRKLLRRRAVASDRRSRTLTLTSEGEAMVMQIMPLARAWERSLLEALDDSQRRQLWELLGFLDARLDEIEDNDAADERVSEPEQ